MKNIILCVVLIFSFFACKQQKEKKIISAIEKHKDIIVTTNKDFESSIGFKQLDTIALIEVLFEAQYDNKAHAARWTPSLADMVSNSIAVDTFPNPETYTKIDTIFYPQKDRAIAVFITHVQFGNKNMQEHTCHGCGMMYSLAYFTQDSTNIWRITSLNKNVGDFGNYGYNGKTKLVEIGKYKRDNKIESIWAVSIPNNYEYNFTGGGYESETWFAAGNNYDINQILHFYVSHDKGGDGLGADYMSPEGETYETTVEIDKNIEIKEYSNYYTVFLNQKGCHTPVNSRDCFPYKSTAKLIYDDHKSEYIPVYKKQIK